MWRDASGELEPEQWWQVWQWWVVARERLLAWVQENALDEPRRWLARQGHVAHEKCWKSANEVDWLLVQPERLVVDSLGGR